MSRILFNNTNNVSFVGNIKIKSGQTEYTINGDSGEILKNGIPMVFSPSLPSEITLENSYNSTEFSMIATDLDQDTPGNYSVTLGPLPMRKTVVTINSTTHSIPEDFTNENVTLTIKFQPPVIFNQNIDPTTLTYRVFTYCTDQYMGYSSAARPDPDILIYDPIENVFVATFESFPFNVYGDYMATGGAGEEGGAGNLSPTLTIIPMIDITPP